MDWARPRALVAEGDMAGRNFGVETWISQLTAFVEQLDYAHVYVAGNSIGGLVAASVAARSDRVEGLRAAEPDAVLVLLGCEWMPALGRRPAGAGALVEIKFYGLVWTCVVRRRS